MRCRRERASPAHGADVAKPDVPALALVTEPAVPAHWQVPRSEQLNSIDSTWIGGEAAPKLKRRAHVELIR